MDKEENLDSSIKEKQDLLKKEILDKNFDQNNFITYCTEKKENGDDLNNWTIEELRQAVEDFKKRTTEIKQSDVAKQSEEINPEVVIKKMDVIDQKEDKQFKDLIIQCKTLIQSKLNGNNINITIRNPKEVDSGVFGQNFITYEVNTQPFGWSVIRRYSDFDNLRKIFLKCYPGFNIPPLPSKKMGTRRFDQDFILKRMKFLELFINTVCENESLKASESLVAFLEYKEREKFENKMKELLSFEPSPYVEEIKTLDGKIVITHDNGNEKYFVNISKYFKIQTQLMNKLNSNLRLYYNNINQAVINLEDIQKNFEILHLLNTRVLMKPQITKTYDELGLFCKNLRSIMIKQNEIIKTNIKDFFKYINLEGQAYNELITKRDEMKLKYETENTKLLTKKEKIWASADQTKMDLNRDDKTLDTTKVMKDKNYAFENMCYTENQSLNHISNQLGYYNKMSILELKKLVKKYVVKYIDNIKIFNETYYPTLTDGICSWQNLADFVETT